MPIERRLLYMLATLVWMGVIFYLSGIPDLKSQLPTILDWVLRKLAHLTEYAILFYLLWRSCDDFRFRTAAVFIFAILYAISDEFHQGSVAGRTPSGSDVLIDAAGMCIAYTKLKPPKRAGV